MFEDPAVMRMVEGRPSLKVMQIIHLLSEMWDLTPHLIAACLHFGLFLLFKTLDSAIVDLGNAMYRKTFEDDVSANFLSHFVRIRNVSSRCLMFLSFL